MITIQFLYAYNEYNTIMKTKFIHFGCWNNLNQKNGKLVGNITNVMSRLKTYIEIPKNKPKFIVVAGDNYYPDKIKVEEQKKKIIIDDNIVDGINLLPTDVDIDMIFGNHDLETNPHPPKKPKLYLESELTPENSDCHILLTELSEISGRNIDYIMYKTRFIEESGTLILMLDTTLYTEYADKSLSCYNTFFHNKSLPIFENIEAVKTFQAEKIMEAIESHHTDETPIKNLIIIGHHPIIGLKSKKGKVGLIDDIPLFFTELVINILKKIKNHVKYYYLCADLHLYQKGTIIVPIDDDGITSHIPIHQYIVGTGGTELDEQLPTEFDVPPLPPHIASYSMEICERKYGFLECILPDSKEKKTILRFIPVETNGGRGKKYKTKKAKNAEKTKGTKRR